MPRSQADHSFLSALAAIVLTVCGGFWGFANPVEHLPALVLCMPAGLFLVGRAASGPKAAFRLGWVAGSAAFAAGLYWVALPVHQYGFLPWVLAVPCPILLGMILGLYSGLFSLGVHLMADRLGWLSLAVWAGCSWAALEVARGVLLSGFPWLVLPSGLAPWPVTLQTAAYIGASGLAGVLAGCAALLCQGNRIFSRPRLTGAVVLLVLVVFGSYAMDSPLPQVGSASISIAQGNIDQSLKWDTEYQVGTADRYAALTNREAEANAPAVVIWPETAMPFYLHQITPLSSRVYAAAKDNGLSVLTGAPGFTPVPEGRGYVLHNRAYLVGTDGQLGDFYDKEHLVPFGEYVPYGEYLKFLGKLVQGVGDFQPGVSTRPLVVDDIAMGVLICYETIFPGLAQTRVASGANVLVNISNDAWFGRSSSPWQHLHMAVLRAVEQHRALVRGTNTGVSAFIGPRGRILARTDLFKTQSLNLPDVPLIEEKSFYHAHRTLLGVVLALLLAGLILLACLARKRQ